MSILINELRSVGFEELKKASLDMGLESTGNKQEIIQQILKMSAKEGKPLVCEGVLETMQDNSYGFMRSPITSYMAGPDDVYVSPNQIRKYRLRTGDTIEGVVRLPDKGERYLALVEPKLINGNKPLSRPKQLFRDLTAEFPNEWLRLEIGNKTTQDITSRIIDMVAPIGKGQRSLIVAPPKTGKTMMLQTIAHAITSNHPECKLIVLMIDERPEEVTEMKRMVRGEVISSTFDESHARHVQVAEMVISKAKRLVENKQDVVILMDSITRLARAYNTITPSSGKVLTGGVDSQALQRPKRLYGAARNIMEGGSLTIIATALIDTGSKMDEFIYEEFKGTGNNEIQLSRQLAQKRIYPAIQVDASSTRRDDLIVPKDEINKHWILRKYLQTMDEVAAMEFLINRLKKTAKNSEFFETMKSD
ncbi:MAG: transcription termination factor Rho [Pseudomonadota bacterium]|nr:transcription termination factor Rho [Pseudomonadota bacterium]MEC8461157.1 transcription termination factor Rho [Pseudomonadota bacterium]